MNLGKTMSVRLKGFVCLLFAVALMFFSPAASHAASGMHGAHHAVPTSFDEGHARDATSSHSMHGSSGAMSHADENDQASGQCCSGICVSVILGEADIVFVEHTTLGIYLMLHERTASLEASSLLRPPQHLI